MAGNARKKHRRGTRGLRAGGATRADPELSICGYPAEGLLLRPAFMAACDDAVKTVARELAGLKGLHVVVGHPHGGALRGKRRQSPVGIRVTHRGVGKDWRYPITAKFRA